MKKLIVAAALAGTLLGGVALAQNGATPASPADGKGPAGWLIKKGDTNGDGAVSRDEFLAKAAERFAKMDTNNDGKITADEVQAAMQARRAGHMGHWGHRRGPGGPGGPEGAGMMPPPGGPGGPGFDPLARLDADNDGKITRAEFGAPADKHFAMLDTNKDGVIDQAERTAAMEKMHARMQEMRGRWHDRGGPDGDMPPPPPPPGDAPTGE